MTTAHSEDDGLSLEIDKEEGFIYLYEGDVCLFRMTMEEWTYMIANPVVITDETDDDPDPINVTEETEELVA